MATVKRKHLPGLITWIGFAFFNAFVLSPHTAVEAFVCVFVAALAATLTRESEIRTGFQFHVRARWIRRLAALPRAIVLDIPMLLLGIWRGLLPHRRVPGKFRVLSFDAGGLNAVDAARRAWVTATGSTAPNTYVVYIDVERNRLLIHQLIVRKKQFQDADPEWPL